MPDEEEKSKHLFPKWIEDEMQWSVKTGLLDHVVPVDQLVDDSYVDYALQVLGPYKPAGQ